MKVCRHSKPVVHSKCVCECTEEWPQGIVHLCILCRVPTSVWQEPLCLCLSPHLHLCHGTFTCLLNWYASSECFKDACTFN
jgi:hypothetical protein